MSRVDRLPFYMRSLGRALYSVVEQKRYEIGKWNGSGVKRGGSMYITKTKAMLDRHYPPTPSPRPNQHDKGCEGWIIFIATAAGSRR